MPSSLKALKFLYQKFGIPNRDILFDIATGTLSENKARNGRDVLWYLDHKVNAAVYIDTLDVLSEDEIEKELF